MSASGTVTDWLERLKDGSSSPLQLLWERYFTRLIQFARQRLHGHGIALASGTDVALSAFQSFHDGVRRGRFPRLEDRHDLWKVLLLLTRQKALALIAQEGRAKRGGGRVQHLSALAEARTGAEEDALPSLLDREPTPEFAAEVAEECRRRLDALHDDVLRRVAVWKMEGYSNAEIAARLGRSQSTVERKLRLIRRLWASERL